MSTNVDSMKMNIQIICILLLRKIYHHSKNLMLITDKTGFSCHILKAQVVLLTLPKCLNCYLFYHMDNQISTVMSVKIIVLLKIFYKKVLFHRELLLTVKKANEYKFFKFQLLVNLSKVVEGPTIDIFRI